MENLLLGVNIIFPVFFVIVLGYFAKNRGYIDDHFVSKATWMVFYMALPLKLFFDIRNTSVHVLPMDYILYILLGTTLFFGGVWLVAQFFIPDKKKLSALVHCSFRSNFVYIGLPILEGILEKPSMEIIIIIIAFGLTLFNILGTIILTFYTEDGEIHLVDFLKKIIKNPMIIAILLGALFNRWNIPIYSGIENGCLLIGRMATPLSLILIGGSLHFDRLRSDFKLILTGALLKVVLMPLLLVPVGILLNFGRIELITAYVFFASPCAVNAFVMTKQLGSDGDLAGKIVTMSFALSIFTYPIGIALLHYFQIL